MWLEEEIDLYHPAARPELPTEFAKVASGEESDLLDFSQTYGLPDFDCVMGSAPRQDLITAYYLGKDLAFLDAYTPGRGDPIDWVLAHARQVRLVLGLVKRLPDESELEAFLQTLIRDGPKGKKIYFEIIKRNERWPLYWCYSEDTPQGYAL
jgi:hypothetical protein